MNSRQRKLAGLALALMLAPFVVKSLRAGTTYVGAINQPVTVTNTPLPVSGTIGVSGSTVTIVTAGGSSTIPISAASLPLPTGAATSAAQNTSNTYLLAISTQLANPLSVTGSTVVLMGSNGSPITSTGNSLNVNMTNSQSVSGSTVQVTGLSGGPVVTTATPQKSTTVSKSSVTATTSSTQLLASDANRVGVECTALCTNTDFVYININSGSAATMTDYPLSPCSSWVPPELTTPTGAIQVIANSGNQVVRCVSYDP